MITLNRNFANLLYTIRIRSSAFLSFLCLSLLAAPVSLNATDPAPDSASSKDSVTAKSSVQPKLNPAEEAKKHFKNAVELGRNKNMEAAAIREYEEALKDDPTMVDAYLNMGAIFFAKEEYAAAEKHFKKALELRPDDTAASANLGATYVRLRKFTEAEAVYTAALKTTPGFSSAYRELGTIQYKQKKNSLAIENFVKYVALASEDYNALFLLGKAYQNQKNFPKAFDALHRAIVIKPSFAEGHKAIGQLFLAGEQFDSALVYYGNAIKLNPGDYQSYYNLAVATQSQRPDSLAECVLMWDRALKACRKNPRGRDLGMQCEAQITELKKRQAGGQ